ncbi:MAG: hypothetical protein PHW73_03490 [Atribacterota bacterium]|nr:hypothetical protein [Atribacterota bacterium]
MPETEKKEGKIIGYEYRNYAACQKCEFKARCTRAKKLEPSAGMLIRTFLTGLIYKPKGTWKNISLDK